MDRMGVQSILPTKGTVTIDAMLMFDRGFLVHGDMTLGPVYTKRQRQRGDNSAMTLAVLFSSKTMESLENGSQLNSGATQLFSMRAELLASFQSCR